LSHESKQMNSSENIISIRSINKFFKSNSINNEVLSSIDLTIPHGDFVAIMGPSGCGKTTLLNIIGLIETPTDGEYYFNNSNTLNLSARKLNNLRKGNIGFIFQSFNLIDELTVIENINISLEYLRVPKKERKIRTTEILTKVKLSHKKDAYPQELSGGQQQKVAIARALAIKPKVILADEPTGNLDSHSGKEIMDMLQQINSEGTTILMVTHSERDAFYARRTVKLFDGKILNG
jgi:putative ABC transport system ATP-binding protein